ncbi:hypothetical protein V6N12_033906 [Hibiscus sabdariffa]|uniref:Uncharacterized protein n=1 Tax=Hibiscus sabdariffa TaxID=183260 RepID=A0ABR2AMY9_9ROSI
MSWQQSPNQEHSISLEATILDEGSISSGNEWGEAKVGCVSCEVELRGAGFGGGLGVEGCMKVNAGEGLGSGRTVIEFNDGGGMEA